MARREPSASRSSSTRSGARSRAGHPRVGRDGKVDIHCPQCGAHYRLAESALETKVTCTDCTRTFFAKTATSAPRPKDNTKVYVGTGLGVVVVIVSLMMMNREGEPSPKRVVSASETAQTQLDIDRKARQDQAMRWARAVAANDLFTLRACSDMPQVLSALGVDAALTGEAQDAAIRQALSRNDATRLFYEMECTAAAVDFAAVQANAGSLDFAFVSKPGDTVYDQKAGARVTVQWRLDATQFKVSGFAVTLKPIVRGIRPGDESKYFKPSEEIAKPKDVEIMRGGQKAKVLESDPVPIAHLRDTPPELQKKVDDLVAEVIASSDPDAPAKQWGRASKALEEIGKPAMPRLINALHGLYGDVNGNNMKLSQVTRTLQQLTGMAFAYDHVGTGDAQKDKAARESSVRQWFAWWWRYANDTYQEAIDQGDDLLEPKDKKPAATKPDAKTGK